MCSHGGRGSTFLAEQKVWAGVHSPQEVYRSLGVSGLVLEQECLTLGFQTGSSLVLWVSSSVPTRLPPPPAASPSRLKGNWCCSQCSGLSGFTQRSLEGFLRTISSVFGPRIKVGASIRRARLSYPNSRVVQNIQASFPFILLLFFYICCWKLQGLEH